MLYGNLSDESSKWLATSKALLSFWRHLRHQGYEATYVEEHLVAVSHESLDERCVTANIHAVAVWGAWETLVLKN